MSKASLSCGLEGWFHVVQKGKDGEIKFNGKFKNLLVNEGMNEIATRAITTLTGACILLSDNTTPTVTETAQDASWSYMSNKAIYTTLAGEGIEYRARLRRIFDFAPSSGDFNISSIGVGYYYPTAGSRRLLSRALVRDEGGAPTTLSILEGDYVQVTYDLYLYPSLVDVTGQIIFDGDIGGTYDYILRPFRVDHLSTTLGVDLTSGFNESDTANNGTPCYTGDIGPVNGTPAGTINTVGTDTSTNGFTYVEDSFTYRRRYRRGLRSNPIDIRCAVNQVGIFAYQIQFDPPIPKTTADILDLTYEVSWARR